MASRRALATAGCSSCRSAVFRLFTADLSISASTSPRIADRGLSTRGRRLPPIASRAYTTTSRLLASSTSDTGARNQLGSSAAETSPNEPAHDIDSRQTSTSESADSKSVPWYLQVEPPRHVATLEPPPLPTVPEDAPAILSSILQYASEEMGLDDLSLLDLRKLDPAPALGSNLFMLFGTARSERHLNVSAGRFVRWLRAKHRVQADADGLLGPNERKTKLRRKARKAKLLQIMGTDETDDGIRTGWVCVNLGTIGRSGPEKATVSEDGRVTGFGTEQQGISIVFQIMTEGRRTEMNLEGLWSESLATSLASHEEPGSIPAPAPAHSAVESSSQMSGSASLLQSSARPVLNEGRTKAMPSSQTSAYSTLRSTGQSASAEADPKVTEVLYAKPEEKRRVLKLLHNFLLQSSEKELAFVLGKDPYFGEQRARETKETAFAELFNAATNGLPPRETWAPRLTFHARCVGIAPTLRAHGAITRGLLQEMQLYGISATMEQYVELLGAICKAKTAEANLQQTEQALTLLNTMQQRGEPTLTGDVLVTLLEHAFSHWSLKRTPTLLGNLWDLIAQAKLPCFDERQLMRLLSAAAPYRDKTHFWEVWNIPPRYFQRRSPAMYCHMLQLALEDGSSHFCAEALRHCLEGMPHERPPVRFEEPLVSKIRHCISIADPRAERLAQREPVRSGDGHVLEEGEFVAVLRQLNVRY